MTDDVKQVLQKRLEELGKEFNELQQRHAQLQQQISDVQTMIVQKAGAIKEINKMLQDIESKKEEPEEVVIEE